MKTTKTMTAARKFVTACRQAGWAITLRENVVTISKYFTAGSREEFVELDGQYYELLSMLKARGGSMWGTDGAGVGGYSAMLNGIFAMNISGVSHRMIAAIHAIDA